MSFVRSESTPGNFKRKRRPQHKSFFGKLRVRFRTPFEGSQGIRSSLLGTHITTNNKQQTTNVQHIIGKQRLQHTRAGYHGAVHALSSKLYAWMIDKYTSFFLNFQLGQLCLFSLLLTAGKVSNRGRFICYRKVTLSLRVVFRSRKL